MLQGAECRTGHSPSPFASLVSLKNLTSSNSVTVYGLRGVAGNDGWLEFIRCTQVRHFPMRN